MRTVLIAGLLFLAFAGGFVHAKSDEPRISCGIDLKMENWKDTVHTPAVKLLEDYQIDLSSPDTFKYSQEQPNHTVKQHNGKAPQALQPYNLLVSLKRDRNIGWAAHERVSVAVSVLERTTRHVIGPFEASVDRQVKPNRESSEDLPSLSAPVNLNGQTVTLWLRCSTLLGG